MAIRVNSERMTRVASSVQVLVGLDTEDAAYLGTEQVAVRIRRIRRVMEEDAFRKAAARAVARELRKPKYRSALMGIGVTVNVL